MIGIQAAKRTRPAGAQLMEVGWGPLAWLLLVLTPKELGGWGIAVLCCWSDADWSWEQEA